MGHVCWATSLTLQALCREALVPLPPAAHSASPEMLCQYVRGEPEIFQLISSLLCSDSGGSCKAEDVPRALVAKVHNIRNQFCKETAATSKSEASG